MPISKETLRNQCKEHRKALSKQQRLAYSQQIQPLLLKYLGQNFPSKLHVLCYQSLASEVSTTELFQHSPAQHDYYAPVTKKNGNMSWIRADQACTWQLGNFNIQEPSCGLAWQPKQDIPAILICPVVGFDRQGNRIGMGKGCFDRWLATHEQHFDIIIGLAFSCQECQSIPHEHHDIALHAVITEQGWKSCLNT
ncbi:MAG: 5-formyltetrahydrofolate cyclo-ligase [Mariprofundaceae bacterium]